MFRLTVVEPGALKGQSWDVVRPRTLIGRAADADWRIEDPSVSRRHAAVDHTGSADSIEDLGSRFGTFVNGKQVSGRVTLERDDEVTLGSVRLRYLDEEAATGPVPSAGPTFNVNDQRAHSINNIGRDQYIQQVIIEREDAMRQIEGMHRVARGLAIPGYALAFAGAIGFIASIVLQGMRTVDMSSSEAFQASTAPLALFGIPLFALFMLLALTGFALVAAGAVVQMSVKRRTNEVDQRYPMPPMTYRQGGA